MGITVNNLSLDPSSPAMTYRFKCAQSNKLIHVQFTELHHLEELEVPQMSLEDKEAIGMMMGIARHRCHLLSPTWTIALPDQAICIAYMDWYTSGNHGRFGVTVLNTQEWITRYGQPSYEGMMSSLRIRGRPTETYLLVYHSEDSEQREL